MNDYQIGPGPELKWRFLYLQHWLIQKNVRHRDLKKNIQIILRKIHFFLEPSVGASLEWVLLVLYHPQFSEKKVISPTKIIKDMEKFY